MTGPRATFEVRRAATVLVLRPAPGPTPVEVLLVRRNRQASFMADAYVFPGGRVDPADAAAGPEQATRHAAARELHEEVSLTVSTDAAALPRFSRWLTPSVEPRRFDTDFFLTALPPGQEPRTDEAEVFDLRWLTPGDALLRYERGELQLPPPTRANLEDLQDEIDLVVAELEAPDQTAPVPGERVILSLLARSALRHPATVVPKLVPADLLGIAAKDASPAIAIVLPWDPDFPRLPGEGTPLPPPVSPRRSSRYLLMEGRWWAKTASAPPSVPESSAT